MERITPSAVRYIKLGAGNHWFDSCRQHQRLELGHGEVPHSLVSTGDWAAVKAHCQECLGKSAATATVFTRELNEFYTLGSDCLWITFADGCLWWAFAEQDVDWLGGDGEAHGYRARVTRGPWRNTSRGGAQLDQSALSSALTQVAGYRQTICQVKASDYLIRKLNDEPEPLVLETRAAEAALVKVAAKLIPALHWRDFETFVDLLFARLGWRRTSLVGDGLKDIDLALEQPATGERAFVQVKSRASQRVVDDYVTRFRRNSNYDRFFLVCHTTSGDLPSDAESGVHVWSGQRLAKRAIRAGLTDWIVQRVG